MELPGPGEPRPDEVLIEVRSAGTISVTTCAPVALEDAADALASLRKGTNGQAVVLRPGPAAA